MYTTYNTKIYKFYNIYIYEIFIILPFFNVYKNYETQIKIWRICKYRVSHFKWAPQIILKEIIFKENDPQKSCCTQKVTYNVDLKIVLNDPPRGYSKVKVFL